MRLAAAAAVPVYCGQPTEPERRILGTRMLERESFEHAERAHRDTVDLDPDRADSRPAGAERARAAHRSVPETH